MADTIKLKRGNAISASAEKITAGEPAFSISEGKLFIGETDAGETISSLNASGKYYIRWDKLNNIPNTKLAGGITNSQLAGGITSAKIGTGEVKTGNIDGGAVNEDKIAGHAVTVGKLNVNGSPSAVSQQDPTDRTDVDAYFWELAKYAAGDGVNATSATTATTATMLAAGVANSSETRPVWFPTSTANNRVVGKPYVCTQYAGGTAVTVNGSSKSGSTASFYAPTGQPSSSSNNFFVQWKTSGAAGWQDVTDTNVKWKRSSYADTADAIKIGNSYYTATFSNGVLQFTAS